MRIGDSVVMLFLYVPNVDRAFQRALDAGCQVVAPVADMFWGDRYGAVQDAFGNVWGLATHTEDVPPAEMKRRAQAAMAQMAGAPS